MELVRRTDNYYGYQMESSDAQQQRFCPINLAPHRPCTRVLCVGVFVKVVNKPCQCTSFKKGQVLQRRGRKLVISVSGCSCEHYAQPTCLHDGSACRQGLGK